MLSHMLRAASARNPITFVSSAFTQMTSNATSITITKPTGIQTGDLMVAFLVGLSAVYTQPTSGGWTPVLADGGRGITYKVATGSESSISNYTWTLGSSLQAYGIILVYRYAQFDVCGTLGTLAVNAVAPAITVGANSSVVICSISNSASASVSYPIPSGWTSRWVDNDADEPSSAGFFKSFDAGSTGNLNLTNSTQSRAVLFSIKPL
jgi:hypothetical protein